MPSAAERQVNLALLLASTRRPVTAAECREAGLGYPDGQDDAAFLRMLERDKDFLRDMGFAIEVTREGGTEAYRIDASATFAEPLDLDTSALAALRTVAASLSSDPGFPFRDDLLLALGKLDSATEDGPGTPGVATVTRDGAGPARALAEAVRSRKTVSFTYTNAGGRVQARDVDPYGLHLWDGRWYLTGRDHVSGDVRTFALTRMTDVTVNVARPHTPDFEPPSDFDIRAYERLPFQYGPQAVTARIRIAAQEAWRAERIARGKGTLENHADGSVTWTVEGADATALAGWLVRSGPGLTPEAPPELARAFADGLRSVVALHG